MTPGRYDNSYGPDSETDSEDEIDKMKRGDGNSEEETLLQLETTSEAPSLP